jgi:hypothetical protein
MNGMGGGGSLPRIVVPQTLRQPNQRTDMFGSLARGFEFGNGIARQRALDAMARQQMVDDDLFRRTVEARQAKQQEESMALQRAQAEDLKRTRDETVRAGEFARRGKNVDTLLSPFDAWKGGEAGSAVAPFYDEAKGYAEMMPGESMDDPVLREAVTGLVGKAKGAADKVYERQAKLDVAKAHAAGARATGAQGRFDAQRQERLGKALTPFARLKTDVDIVTGAVQSNGKGLDYEDSIAYQQNELRTGMDPQAVRTRRAAQNVFNWFMREGAGLAQTDSEALRQMKAHLMGSRVQRVDFVNSWNDLLAEIDKAQAAATAAYEDDEVNDWMGKFNNPNRPRIIGGGGSAPPPPAVPSTFKPRGK